MGWFKFEFRGPDGPEDRRPVSASTRHTILPAEPPPDDFPQQVYYPLENPADWRREGKAGLFPYRIYESYEAAVEDGCPVEAQDG